MEYHTAYFRQESERNLSSLVLQQVYHKTKNLPIVFTCVGWAEETGYRNGETIGEATLEGGGRMKRNSCEQGHKACEMEEALSPKPAAKAVADLMDWFYARGLQLCIKKGEDGIYQVGRILRRQFIASKIDISLVGMLGVGRRLCIFHVGNTSVRVLNLQKGVAYSKELQLTGGGKHGIGMQYAFMEPGIGVMLGTDGFWKGVSHMCVEECLNVKELDGQFRVEKRLWELGKQGELQGGTDMAVVLLVTK